MPRKKQGDGAPVTFWLERESISKLDQVALKTGLTRSKVVQMVVDTVVDEVLLYNKIGVYQFNVIMDDIKISIRSGIENAVSGPTEFNEIGKLGFSDTVSLCTKDGHQEFKFEDLTPELLKEHNQEMVRRRC